MKVLYRFYFVPFFFPTSNERQLHLSYILTCTCIMGPYYFSLSGGYVVKAQYTIQFSHKSYIFMSISGLLGTHPPFWLAYLACLLTDPSLAFTLSSSLPFRAQIKYHFLFLENFHWLLIPKLDQALLFHQYCVSPIPPAHRTEPGLYHRHSIDFFDHWESP